MDMQNDEITLEDFKNYNDDISKFMMHQQIEFGTFFHEGQQKNAFEFRTSVEVH